MNSNDVTRNSGEFTCHHNDKKFYKSVTLSNNLNAVLISSNSKEDNTASIALSIQAGSFDDPKHYEGLSHLLSNLIIREANFLEQIENEEIIESEEEEIIEEKVIEKPSRSKRTKTRKVNQTKKVVKMTKKILEEPPKERQTSSLMYQLSMIKGTIKLITEFEYTTFQLDLPTENLDAILKDFALRFKQQPTFSNYLIRETLKPLKHDYFQKIKENSMMKLKILLCNLVGDDKLKNYPSNPFLDVQTDDELNKLRDQLLDFLQTKYKPNRMKLILKSNLSISEMESMLNRSFGDLETGDEVDEVVKSKPLLNKAFVGKENQNMFYIRPYNKKPEIEDYLPIRQNLMVNLDIFEEHNLNEQLEETLVDKNGLDMIISDKISYDNNHLIFNYTSQRQIQSRSDDEQTSDQLYFTFNIPHDKNHYLIMPMHFISSLITKDGPNTLINYLRKREFATQIKAGNLPDCNFANNSLWNLFFVKIHLTKKGLPMSNEIIRFTNAYLNMLTKLDNLKSLFEEYCKLTLFEYNFKEIRSQSYNDLFVTVKKMHLYPIKHILVANRIPLHKSLGNNLKVIQNLMKYIKIEASVIAILTDESSFDAVDSICETFKGIDLKKEPVDKTAFKNSDLFKVDDFPSSNPFLKNSFKINLEAKVFSIPELLMTNKDKSASLWYKKESKELLSLTSVNLLISNTKFKNNAKMAAVCDLILVISEMQMNELFFQIREAGFLYRVEFNRFGMCISATGSDEIINVFKQILSKLKNVVTGDMLSKAKLIASKNYENALYSKFKVYLDLQNYLLFNNHHTIQDRKSEIKNIELKDLNQIMQMMFGKSRRDYFIEGNYMMKDAKLFFNETEKMFEYCSDDQIVDCGKMTTTKNQTYFVSKDGSIDLSTTSSIDEECLNELFPRRATEYYCVSKLSIDWPDSIMKEDERKKMDTTSEYDISVYDITPDSSYKFKMQSDDRRCVESTSVKNVPNRNLFMMSNNCLTFNASRIERSIKNKSSLLKSVCTDITNVNYRSSPMNHTNNESHNFSSIINEDTQIVGNLYFTNYTDDVLHGLLLRILVGLIKQNMNGFFTNEQNLRDGFFNAGSSCRNKSTPEITFQDPVLIDGQIECAEFELTDSKGFIFIVFDNYLLLNAKSIDSLVEAFLSNYMFIQCESLKEEEFDEIIKKLNKDLCKKPSWSEDVIRNWNEILIGKRRFDLINQQKYALKTKINLNFFKRWSCGILGKVSKYSKLSIQLLKDEKDEKLSNFSEIKKLHIEKQELPKPLMSFIKVHSIDDLVKFKQSC